MQNFDNLLPDIKKCCRTAKLRPDIQIDKEFNTYQNIAGVFSAIHFYWNEYFYDNISGSDRVKHLMDLVSQVAQTLPNYISHEWGESDGHLFIYITFLTFDAFGTLLKDIKPENPIEQEIKNNLEGYLDDQKTMPEQMGWDNVTDLIGNFCDEVHDGAFSESEGAEIPLNDDQVDAFINKYIPQYKLNSLPKWNTKS